MSWTYSGNPTDSPKDEVRFAIGDTDTNAQLLTDEEIEFLLVDYTPQVAAVRAAENIGRRFARMADKHVGPLRILYGSRAETWAKTAATLAKRAGAAVAPYMGTESERAADREDDTYRQPGLTIDQFDSQRQINPRVSGWF